MQETVTLRETELREAQVGGANPDLTPTPDLDSNPHPHPHPNPNPSPEPHSDPAPAPLQGAAQRAELLRSEQRKAPRTYSRTYS